MVEEKLEFPKTAGDYFDSKRSTLNPYNRGEGSFVYGTLPMVLAKAVAPLLGKKGYGETHLVGRALSGFFDLLTVWLVYRITRRFTHRRAALLRRRPLVLLRPGHPALALLGGRRGPHGLHRRGAVRSRADCPGPFRSRQATP